MSPASPSDTTRAERQTGQYRTDLMPPQNRRSRRREDEQAQIDSDLAEASRVLDDDKAEAKDMASTALVGLPQLIVESELASLTQLGQSSESGEFTFGVDQGRRSDTLTAQATTSSLPEQTATTAQAAGAAALESLAPPQIGGLFALGGAVIATKDSSRSSETITKLRVVDGPVEGAKVYLDLDKDGVIDEGEPEVGSTDLSGFADIKLSPEQTQYALLAKGGMDTETNKAFAGVLAAPAGSTVINPLTTLVAAIMEGGQSLSEAKASVVNALGLIGVSDLTSYDTFAQASTTEGMANHLKAVQIANIIVAGSALAASDNSSAAQIGAASRVIDALAATITGTTGEVTFNATVLEAVLTDAGASSNAASVAAAIETVNRVVANASGLGLNALAQVAQAQVLAQVTLTNAIKTADTGGLATVQALQDLESVVQMASQIDATSTDVTAPTLTIISDKDTLKSGETATVTFTFSKRPQALLHRTSSPPAAH